MFSGVVHRQIEVENGWFVIKTWGLGRAEDGLSKELGWPVELFNTASGPTLFDITTLSTTQYVLNKAGLAATEYHYKMELERAGVHTLQIDGVYYTMDGGKLVPMGMPMVEPHCFLAGTEITMWDGSKKPIEEITPNDWVLSHDKVGNPKPGRVVRTFTNQAKIILDFHGTFVTPGHVYFCAGGKYEGRFAPLIDILRDDGVVQHEDGTLIRAATGCAVGSDDDKEFWAFTAYEDKDGTERIRDKKKLRLGTRWMLPNGHHFTMREYMAGVGMELLDDGYVQFKQTGLKVPFIWTFSANLPNPEDFVLARSQTTLEDIYRADQWEAMPPTMPVPLMRDSGPVMPMSERQLDAAPRNMPMAFENQTASSELTSNRPRMNRKQRMAHEAKQRSAEKARRKAMH